MVFFVFSRGLFKFSRVVQSNSYLAKTATNVFFEFYRFALPAYKNYAKCSHIGVPLPGNRRQKDSVHCCVIMHAQ